MFSNDNTGENNPKTGYGSPPVEYRFKLGQSGNPKGRPRHPATFEACLNRQFSKKIKITEDGHTRKETVLSVTAKQFTTALAKGDIEYMKLFSKYYTSIVNIEKELYAEPVITDDTKDEKTEKAIRSALRELIDLKGGTHPRLKIVPK